MSSQQIFNDAWNECLKSAPPARFAKGIKTIPYAALTAAIEARDEKFIREFVRSFYSGNVYVFTNAFDPKDLETLKRAAFEWGKSKPSEEPQIVARVGDYRSRRDWHAEDHGFGYSSTYDMFHFFRWNDDPIGIFKLFDPKYRVLRIVNGVDPEAVRDNGPDDDIIDRAEISHYPRGVGGIAFHEDPIAATRFAFTVNLNRFGLDYHAGGFGVGIGDGGVLPVDPTIEVGSLTGFLPSVCHGVEIIDPGLAPTWDAIEGRWYGAITMINPHKKKGRRVTTPIEGYPTLRQQVEAAKEKRNASVA